MFAPDPLALTDPATAMAHYIGRSGEPRNYYFSSLDTSSVAITSFPTIKKLIDQRASGIHTITNDQFHDYDSGVPLAARGFSGAHTIGRIPIYTDGVLAISSDGRYTYNGILRANSDRYDFNHSKNRSTQGSLETWIGRQVPGVPFQVYIVGSKPITAIGHAGKSR